MFAAFNERTAYRRRSAKKINQQPEMAAETADKREITPGFKILQGFITAFFGTQYFPQTIGKRNVVMHPGDSLHGAAITMTKADAVNGFHGAAVGATVTGHRNFRVAAQFTRHARGPKTFLLRFKLLIAEAVNIVELLQK